ncbi:MAG: class II aldolase/adducin family protein [Lautropia sp.]
MSTAAVRAGANAGSTRATDARDARIDADEWALRVDLAACYRLIAMLGWDDLIFTHISARVPGPEHHFLINPYGLAFEEITASSLVKIDQQGGAVLPTTYPVNRAGFVIHGAIHAARPDIVCVLHTHTVAGVAVSAQREGLLPISQQATIALSSLAYHDYEGIAVRDDEKPRLQRDLGSCHNLILRNHGLLTVGPSIPDAFLRMFTLERACQIQIAAQSGGQPLIAVRPEVLAGVGEAVRKVAPPPRAGGARSGDGGAALAWPALLRRLVRVYPGYDE